MFSVQSKSEIFITVTLNLSSANAFILVRSKTSSFGKELTLLASLFSVSKRAASHKNTKKTENKDKNVETPSKTSSQFCCWLMKSEPESRFEKGVDVKVQNTNSATFIILRLFVCMVFNANFNIISIS